MADELEVKKPASIAPQSQPAKPKLTKADFERSLGGDPGRLRVLAEAMSSRIAAALPRSLARHENRFVACLMTECQKQPSLLNCTGLSLIGSLIQVAQLGLELGGPAGQAHLIPFKSSCQLVIGYKGYLTLAHRSDKLKRCSPRIIYHGDTWDIIYGSEQKLVHVPKFYEDKEEEAAARQKIIGYYTTIEMMNGGGDFEFLTPYQAEQWRAKNAMMKNGGPWVKNFDEMALKTTIRRLCKRLPLSVESVSAASLDECADEEIGQNNESLVQFDSTETPSLEDRFADARQAKSLE